MSILHLHVRTKYFEQISSGEKLYEYRLYNPFWIARLMGQKYQAIVIYKGYPKKTKYNSSNRIKKPWRGCDISIITHPEFGDKPITAFAIRVNP